MEKWLDLLTPSAAALALVLGIALVVQAIRHGRAVRRLESRLAEREGAGARVSLDRLTQLQRRARPGRAEEAPAGPRARSPRLPPLGTVAAVLVIVALVAGTAWYLFLRDDTPVAATGTTTAQQQGQTRTAAPAPPQTNTAIPETPAALERSKSAYTILVLNGSGVPRAAANVTAVVTQAGWGTAPPDNATTSDEATSFVVYLPGQEDVADNIAKDLGITRKLPQDGVEVPPDTPDVDAIVIVGRELAQRSSP